MTTNTMRRVRQKQRADRMLPAHSFQDQRLWRFLPVPKPRSRTSDELRQAAVKRSAHAGLTREWFQQMEALVAGMRLTRPPVFRAHGEEADAPIIDAAQMDARAGLVARLNEVKEAEAREQ